MPEEPELVGRTNAALIGAHEDMVAHYLEAEIVEICGAARGVRGWPTHERLRQVKGWLKGLRARVEKYRLKWSAAEEKKKARRAMLTEAMVLRRFQADSRRIAFEQWWGDLRMSNQASLRDGTFTGVIVPIGWEPGAQDEGKAKAKAMAKGEGKGDLGAASFFAWGEEQPEGEVAGEQPEVGGEVGGGEVGGEEGGEPGGQVGEPGQEVGVQAPGGSKLLRELTTGHEERISKPTYQLLEAAFIAKATVEDLSEEHRRHYEEVKHFGAGTCARCRWGNGCSSCEAIHAWEWACRCTLYEGLEEPVRPKPKPKGRPKAKA